MVYPIHSQSHEPFFSTETAQQKQAFFELNWEMGILTAYMSATQKNDPVMQHLSNLSAVAAHGKTSASQIANDLNQIISKINIKESKTSVSFPSFEFTSSHYKQALSHYLITIEKFIHAASEKNLIPLSKAETLFKDGSRLFESISSDMFEDNVQEGFHQLDALIQEFNKSLPANIQCPSIIPAEFRKR